MGRVKRKKTRSPKYVVEQPSAKLSSHRKKSSDPSHRKTAADIFKEDPSAIDRVQSLRLYDEDDSYDREAIDRVQTSETPEKPPTGSSVISSQVDQIGTVTEDVEQQSLTGIVSDREEIDRVHSLRFYKTDDSYDREEKDRVHSLRFYKTDDSYDREAKDRVHSLQKTSETPDFPKLSEKPPHGVISSQVNQIGTVSEVVKMAKDAQGSVVMSQTSGETNDSFTADLSLGVIKSGAPCRGERLAKYNQVFC